jgi:negative regulator of flagellin synthesis FlgM
MKIDDLMGDVISKYGKQSKILDKKPVRKVNNTDDAKNVSKIAQEDKVEISKNAKILLQLDEGGDKAEKISRIKTQISNGTYKPNIEETAKSILKEWMGE